MCRPGALRALFGVSTALLDAAFSYALRAFSGSSLLSGSTGHFPSDEFSTGARRWRAEALGLHSSNGSCLVLSVDSLGRKWSDQRLGVR
jgi:hypothetical protein